MKTLDSKLKLRGFTLVEIMMAMGMFGVIFGSIAHLLIAGIEARRDAALLNQSVLLAKKYMDEAKQLSEETSKEEDAQGFPGYHCRYQIKEEEKDLFEGFDNSSLESLGVNSASSELRNKESVTAGIVKVLHYEVIVNHKSGLNYDLHYYRILQR